MSPPPAAVAARSTFVSDEALLTAPLSSSTLEMLMQAAAARWTIPEEQIKKTIEGESQFKSDAVGDMNITCTHGVYMGLPVRARGLAQITRCYHPEVTDAQAFNPRFSIEWLAREIAIGRGCIESSVYRRLYCVVK